MIGRFTNIALTKETEAVDVWGELSPKNIVLGGDGAGTMLAGMAKFFFALSIVCLVITSFIAIGYYAMGSGRKGEGKDLLMSKLVIAIVTAAGVALLDAVFITATNSW